MEKKKKKQRKSEADMSETNISIVYKQVIEDINLEKWLAYKKRQEEKEKKEQEKQKEINIRRKFQDMTWYFARKGVHVFLSLGNKQNKKKKIWN